MEEFLRLAAFDIPDIADFARVSVRLFVAALLAAFIGWERERHGRAAGLRTHMMVALGAAMFTLVPLEAGVGPNEIARIAHGVAAGVGFLGAGAILKITTEKDIVGLTTAASIWLTAAIGVAAGAGQMLAGILATIVSIIVLWSLRRLELRAHATHPAKKITGGRDHLSD